MSNQLWRNGGEMQLAQHQLSRKASVMGMAATASRREK